MPVTTNSSVEAAVAANPAQASVVERSASPVTAVPEPMSRMLMKSMGRCVNMAAMLTARHVAPSTHHVHDIMRSISVRR